MVFRLVRPVRRKGSSFQQVTQCIPADLLGRMTGIRLSVPLGEGEFHHLTVTAKARDVRLSLRTRVFDHQGCDQLDRGQDWLFGRDAPELDAAGRTRQGRSGWADHG